MSVVSASPQPSFARIGSILMKIAKHECYAVAFAVIASLFLIAGTYVVSLVFLPMGVVVASLIVAIYARVQWFTRETMNAMETIGTANNSPQLVKFSRFLFNSIAVGFIGFIWAVLCTIVMITPFMTSTSIVNYTFSSIGNNASLAGEITLSLVIIVMGFMYIPHAYKSWKYIDDYFILLHDPWPRDVGLAGVKKILGSCKVAFVAMFFAIPALGGYVPAVAILVFLVPQALVASGKYIQGLNQVGDAFVRVQTMSLYATSTAQAVYRPPTASQGYTPQSTPQPIMRYQPSQALYAGGTTPQRRTPSAPILTPDNPVSRDLLERSNAFIQIVNQDPTAPGRQGAPTQAPTANTVPETPASPSTVDATTSSVPRPPVRSPRCRYCLAELPAPMPAKCPSCNGVLVDLGASQ